jgi:hypothetical protein
MNPRTVSRREFLRSSGAGAAIMSAAVVGELDSAEPNRPAASVATDTAGLTTYQLGPQIWIRWNNVTVTCYRAHRSQKYPYLYPLTGPLSGLSVTTETSLPYPHHRSCFFACDRVNGGNYWQDEYDRGQILSGGPKLGQVTDTTVEVLDACDWQLPNGPVVMRDQRRISITAAGPSLRFLDLELQWQAVEDISVPKTNHALFAVRAATDLSPTGGGQLVNAEGLSGEKATFGKPSAWCDFSGKRQGIAGDVVEGIALLDHPGNPWAPTPWFTRDYGFISPSPMFFREEPWQLAAGKSVTLRYRVVVHAGDAQAAGIPDVFRSWTSS